MIKEIKNELDTPNWDKIITLELTLKDLQIIFDAVGDLPPQVIKDKHMNSPLHDIMSIDTISMSNLIDEIYGSLEVIIDKYNGVLDD